MLWHKFMVQRKVFTIEGRLRPFSLQEVSFISLMEKLLSYKAKLLECLISNFVHCSFFFSSFCIFTYGVIILCLGEDTVLYSLRVKIFHVSLACRLALLMCWFFFFLKYFFFPNLFQVSE